LIYEGRTLSLNLFLNSRTVASPAPTTQNATFIDVVGANKSLVANECLNTYKTKNETMSIL